MKWCRTVGVRHHLRGELLPTCVFRHKQATIVTKYVEFCNTEARL